jgi:plasmid stabilization system protein ParE
VNYKIQITEEAEVEIRKATDWYSNISLGLGEKFSSEIKDHVESFVEHKLVVKNCRRMLLHNFPYTIYYSRNEQERVLEIIAVLHNRQSLNTLADRI